MGEKNEAKSNDISKTAFDELEWVELRKTLDERQQARGENFKSKFRRKVGHNPLVPIGKVFML